MKDARSNWSRPLPRQLVIRGVMTLKTLADVRTFMKHVPVDRRERSTWRYVAVQLQAAADGGIESIEASVTLRLALMLEGVRCDAR
jgi:hypothetical protein